MLKGAAAGVALVVALVLLFGGLYYGGVFANDVQANYNKRVVGAKIQQRVHTADFAQGAYEHFYNLCAAIQGQEAALAAQYDELASASNEDASRIQANIAGLTAERGRSIAQYNAEARQTYTLGQFRANDLPFQLPNTTYTKGTVTSCG